jgi:hypothetical protein
LIEFPTKYKADKGEVEMSGRKLDIFILAILSVLIGLEFIFFHTFFKLKDHFPPFSYELMTAVLGTIFTVATMAAILKWQHREKLQREYEAHVFREKLKIYQELLKLIFEMYDDMKIDHEEITAIENKVGEACLVAGEDLVKNLSQFLLQLKIYGCLYHRNMKEEKKAHFVKYFKKHGDYLATSKDPESLKKENFQEYFISLDDITMKI